MSDYGLEQLEYYFLFSRPYVWWIIAIYLSIPISIYIILPFLTFNGPAGKRKTVSIIVLGDLGHSPRMCYHALSFSSLDFYVNLCGYIETLPPPAVVDDINIETYPIEVVTNTSGLPYLVFAIKKIILQFFLLVSLLFKLRGSDYFMIQNPPSIPILAILIVFIKLFSRRSRLVIDWHNLNYTILNLKFNNLNHPLVKFLKLYEHYLGKFAWLNITVTKQMKKFLISEFDMDKRRIIVLHDRPANQFQPLTKTKHSKLELLANHVLFEGIKDIQNYKILVSATSFTPDEDFGILLDALKKYDLADKTLPPILLIVTGKGPLKSQFLERVEALKFLDRVIIRSAWLSSEDYPVILSLADLGVSLHTSLSGIDLPMKIVDFFGVGVPVVTLSFPAIGELVTDGVNGLVTHAEKDSAVSETDEMFRLISNALGDPVLLGKLKDGALHESDNRWRENWTKNLGMTFNYTKQ